MAPGRSAPLTLAVAQPVIGDDLADNVAAHSKAVRRARARVVVFPELSLSGYHFDAPSVDPADTVLEPLVEVCGEGDSIALVGAPVDGADGRHIAMLAVDGSGAEVVYRKRFLGEAERNHFVAGTDPAVVIIDGWRIGLAICKDTGVTDHTDETVAAGIDVLAAGVLEHRHDGGVQPERARRLARAEKIWVAVASFAGSTGEGYDEAAGGSFILGPDLFMAARVGGDPGAVAVTTLLSQPTRRRSVGGNERK